MRFWFARSGEVSIREQLVTQVSLGILAGELGAGERLPSIRELARRFSLHPNTVSAGYRQLERERWVEFRRGSGVYVRATAPQELAETDAVKQIDRMIVGLFGAGRALGIAADEVRARVLEHRDALPPERLLLLEYDVELREIVLAELAEAVTLPIAACGLPTDAEAANTPEFRAMLKGSMVLALPSKAEGLRAALRDVAIHVLKVRSIPASLAAWLPAPTDALVGVASRWPPFLDFARTMLIATGFDADALMLRDARKEGWTTGLGEAKAVVCDCCTAPMLPAGVHSICFRLLAEDSVAELQRAVTEGL